MNLLAPLGLFALISIPLIVIFHMRHFTPYERPVPTLRFWREAEPSRTDDSRFRIPPLTVLLLLQLLIAGLLGLSLARPAVSSAWAGLSQQATMRHLVIVLDGSTSMSATDTAEALPRFEVARASALSHLDDLREGDMATVMVLGTQVSTLQASSHAEIGQLSSQIRSMTPPGGIADLDSALRLIADLDMPGVREEILVLTDGALAADPAIVDTLNADVSVEIVGGVDTGNLAITDVTARTAASDPARSELFVQVTNFSGNPAPTTVLAVADGFEVFRRDIAVEANNSRDVVIDSVPEGASNVVIEVRSNDPFFADNQARIQLAQESDFALRILLVADSVSPLQKALTSLQGAVVVPVTSTENERGAIPAGAYDLVVYDGTSPLPDSVPDSPLLLIDPPRDGIIPMQGMMSSPSIERLRANDPVLRGVVGLSGLTFFETPVHVLDSSAVEIAGSEGGTLIYRADVPGRDQPMIVVAFDPEQSNLPRRLAFPILVANMVSELSPSPLPSSIQLGDALTYTPHSGVKNVQIVDPAETTFTLPVPEGSGNGRDSMLSRDVTFTATGLPGEYQLTELTGSGQIVATASFVVNAGHPQESDLRQEPELPAVLAGASARQESGSQQLLNDIWPALAAIALLALIAEWFWTHWSHRISRRSSRPMRA